MSEGSNPPRIKAVALDVDGVLTDGTFWWGMDGREEKRFSFRDVMGISRASRQGVIFALISGEKNQLIDRYAAKMSIRHVWQGCQDKAAALREFAAAAHIELEEICFIGDDVNDVAAMQLAGFSASPADGHQSARSAAKMVSQFSGGKGAVREVLDNIFLNR